MLEILPKGEFLKLTGYSISGVVTSVIVTLLIIATVSFLLVIVISGIVWMASGGDSERKSKARVWLTNGFYGLLSAFVFWAILYLVGIVFGLPGITQFNLPTLSAPFGDIVGGIPRGDDGGKPSDPSTPAPGVGNCNCGCGGAGGWAETGTKGPLTLSAGECYLCTNSGWVSLGYSGCTPITCRASCATP